MVVLADAEYIKMMVDGPVFDGMDGIEVFHEYFHIAQVVTHLLPVLADAFRPGRSGGRRMRAGKDAQAAEAVVFAVQLFGMHKRGQLADTGPVIVLYPVVATGAGRKRVMIRAPVFS